MQTFKKIVDKVDMLSGYLSCLLIFANMAVVTYSVIMRLFFGKPISGLVDLVGFISAMAAAFSLGYTEHEKGFIQVDFVKEYFPKAVQRALHLVLGVLALITLLIVAYRFVLYGISCKELGTVSWTMYLPYYPVCFMLVIGCLFYCLTSLYYFLEEISSWKKEETK